MHKSRLGTFIIDCESTDLDRDAKFWSDALGYDIVRRYEPGDERYRMLANEDDQPKLLLQQVDHESRIHLDIETDDIEAEADRLEGLGAKRLQHINGWWGMEAPSGHRFCIVKPQRKDFEERANEWESK